MKKIKILRGKFPRTVVNVVIEKKLDIGKLKRVGLNEIVKSNRTKDLSTIIEQSFRKLADSYSNDNFVHVNDNKEITNKRNVNIITVLGPNRWSW